MDTPIGDKLDLLFAQYDELTSRMNAIGNLDQYGIPYNLDSPDGQTWETLSRQRDEIAQKASQFVINYER